MDTNDVAEEAVEPKVGEYGWLADARRGSCSHRGPAQGEAGERGDDVMEGPPVELGVKVTKEGDVVSPRSLSSPSWSQSSSELSSRGNNLDVVAGDTQTLMQSLQERAEWYTDEIQQISDVSSRVSKLHEQLLGAALQVDKGG